MNFLELSTARYSLRKFAPQQIEYDKLNTILEAGRLAPTAVNKQPQRIYVLKSDEAVAKARNVTRMMYTAPMALLVCYDDTESWKNTEDTYGEDYEGGEVDAAIVTTAMMMQATELGVGTLWARGFDSRKMSAAFELPANIHPVVLLLLGYPADETVKPASSHFKRKELCEIVTIL